MHAAQLWGHKDGCETVSSVPLLRLRLCQRQPTIEQQAQQTIIHVCYCDDCADPDTGRHERHCFLLPPSADMLWYLLCPWAC